MSDTNRDARDDALDAELDARLRSAFAPPPPQVLQTHAERAVAPSTTRPGPWPWYLVAAGVLVIATFALLPSRRGPEGHDGLALGAMWAAAFQDAVAHGFDEGSCCQPNFDLPATCRAAFAVPLELPVDSGVSLVGCYCGKLPTGGCMVLLTAAAGERVCVYVVPRRQDPGVVLPQGSSLHLSRRELGELVLYSLSQSPATALDRFVLPEQ